MSSKSKHGKKKYYIIRGVDIPKKQSDLEDHMIDHFFYENLDLNEHRVSLQERIHSYSDWTKTFCATFRYTGMDTYFSLTNYISNTLNTIIYSTEGKHLDCVLLFREEHDEKEEPYIFVVSFCANQVIPSKKGGVFFEHFLNSIRGQYTKIELSSSPKAYRFYKSFHFLDEFGDGNMTRNLSPTSDRQRLKHLQEFDSESEDEAEDTSKKDMIVKLSELKNTWSSYKYKPFVKRDYYIIRANKHYITEKQHNLEQHMIDKYRYKYKIDGSVLYNRDSLSEAISSYNFFLTGFCQTTMTRQGGINSSYLVSSVLNLQYTVIYSMENDNLDCVLVFNQYNKTTIYVKAFCSNQVLKTKKGGIFFEYFLNSLRDKYKNITLNSAADDFYRSFHFSENSEGEMERTLSPKSGTNRTRKQRAVDTITGNTHILHMPSQIHSAPTRSRRKSKSKSKSKSVRQTLSI